MSRLMFLLAKFNFFLCINFKKKICKCFAFFVKFYPARLIPSEMCFLQVVRKQIFSKILTFWARFIIYEIFSIF